MSRRATFSLFHSHLDLAHDLWKKIIQAGDIVIDATCGNGYDTLFLAQHAILEGKIGNLIAIDKQAQAIETTKQRLEAAIPQEHLTSIRLLNQCHSSFPADLNPASVTLIVYNLGYLPGGDKALTTLRNTTQQSLTHALLLLRPGGMLSVTCYPGHPEGKEEEETVLRFASQLASHEWSCCHHRWLNRPAAPSLLIIQKALTN